MPETSFIKAVEATLARPYRDNPSYHEYFLQSIDGKLKQSYDAETNAKLEELKIRLVAQKEEEMAPRVGGSKITID